MWWRASPLRRWIGAGRRAWLRHRGLIPAYAPNGDVFFDAEDVQKVRDIYFAHGSSAGGAWDAWRHAHMRLPTWFRHGLDPWGEEYSAQQQRLWRLITGVERLYSPAEDEKEFGWEGVDAVRRPGYYMRRDAQAVSSAGDHWIATGMLLKHCRLASGDRALEYGAGFGQSALALARLGVQVDTVDISEAFCGFVREQAKHFDVPLEAFCAPFGTNPRPGERYKLIWFYESFHHCLDFAAVVPRLEQMLDDGGCVILGGEPVVDRPNAAVPYPWGVRLHSEVIAVMRQTRWFELGFTEAFLLEVFDRSGLHGRRVDCDASEFGRLYVFDRRWADRRR